MTEPSEQAAQVLGPLSGTAIVWSLDLGLRLGIFEQLVKCPSGATAEEVANALDLDRQYTHVILRAAYAAEALDLDDGRYRLAEHRSEATVAGIDAETGRIVAVAWARATAKLVANRGVLGALADELIASETLEGAPLGSLLGRVVPTGDARIWDEPASPSALVALAS